MIFNFLLEKRNAFQKKHPKKLNAIWGVFKL